MASSAETLKVGKSRFKLTTGKIVLLALVVLLILYGLFFVEDWHHLWTIASAPDNIPIVALLPFVAFFTWLGVKRARGNDRLIERVERDPQTAKHDYRTPPPWR